MKRLIASFALLSWLLCAPALAQQLITVPMRDANLTTTNVQNFITTSNTFTAPRTLTVPDRSSLNAYYIQVIDTANAVNGANTLTITATGGNLINGSATLVISQPGAYIILTPSGTGYKATTAFNQTGPPLGIGGSNTQVQYNNAGAFGGISGATSNGTAIILVAPILGTPASGTLTNTTGFPVANLAGAGTGVLAALAVNVGSAGAPILFNGAGGTPTSLVGTNITGTAAGLTAGAVSTAGIWIGRQTWCASGCTNASGTSYTPTSGTTLVNARLCGGGGGGGGCAATAGGQGCSAGGGGSGGYAEERITSAFSGVTVTAGTGGNGGAAGLNNGAAGNTSSFGALNSATGGAGGSQGATGTPPSTGGSGGAGGIGSGANINSGGMAGINGFTLIAGFSAGGNGGSSIYGGGAQAAFNSAGTTASTYCAGGSGAGLGPSASAAAGGNGSSGIVIVDEFK